MHFAAESHVDRSILGPDDFIRTNVHGTFCLLEEARAYCEGLAEESASAFRFLHVSTDEVYGSLVRMIRRFARPRRMRPTVPYSASKAGADHLVRAYHHTYGLPTSDDQLLEQLWPLSVPRKTDSARDFECARRKAIARSMATDGMCATGYLSRITATQCVRFWPRAKVGETYNIGGQSEKPNIEIVEAICSVLDQSCPNDPVCPIEN